MLNRMIKLELRKALKSKLFYGSIGIGCVITIVSLVYYLGIQQNQLSLLRATKDTNPTRYLCNVFTYWIGGEPFSLGTAVYFFVFPLLVAIPYGWSYCEEKRSGYVRMVAVRSGRVPYFLSKYIAVFLSGGLAMVIPLAFSFLSGLLFFPAYTPMPIDGTSNAVFLGSLMSSLYYSIPFLYVFFYLCIDFLFCGLIACLSYGVTCFIKYRAITVILPMFLLLAFHYIAQQFIYISPQMHYKELSPLFFLRPAAALYNASWTVILAEMAVLFLVTFFMSLGWERRHEIY